MDTESHEEAHFFKFEIIRINLTRPTEYQLFLKKNGTNILRLRETTWDLGEWQRILQVLWVSGWGFR